MENVADNTSRKCCVTVACRFGLQQSTTVADDWTVVLNPLGSWFSGDIKRHNIHFKLKWVELHDLL